MTKIGLTNEIENIKVNTFISPYQCKQLTDRQVNELKSCCDQVFIEDGVSARKKKRPVYKMLISQLSVGDEIVVVSYGRAFRSVIQGLNTLDELTARTSSLPHSLNA